MSMLVRFASAHYVSMNRHIRNAPPTPRSTITYLSYLKYCMRGLKSASPTHTFVLAVMQGFIARTVTVVLPQRASLLHQQ